jgi:hypothetical protein
VRTDGNDGYAIFRTAGWLQPFRVCSCSLACILIRLLNFAMLGIDGSLCVFCGSRANSKEHVFAKSVCEHAGDINFAELPDYLSKEKKT